MKYLKHLCVSACLLATVACAQTNDAAPNRLVGGDISLLPSYEEKGVSFLTQGGQTIDDLVTYLASDEVGWNAIRLRLFVDPVNASATDKGEGVWQSLDYITPLAQRVKAAGLQLMIDFHYSDSWADPGKQHKPKAWESLTDEALVTTLYDYTRDALQHLADNGAAPDYIQIGNEISFGMLWETAHVDAYHDKNWTIFAQLLNSGAKACREVCPDARIIIHTEQAGNTTTTVNYYKKLDDYGVDYDIIGLSYYPFWHKSLSQLSTTLNALGESFPERKVQIVETAYYYQYAPSSGYDAESAPWPSTREGQKAYADAIVAELNKHANVNGLYWWFPEENGYRNSVLDSWINRGLFDNNTGRALPALYSLKAFAQTTGVSGLAADRQPGDDLPAYNLAGQRVEKQHYKGILVSGKAYLQK